MSGHGRLFVQQVNMNAITYDKVEQLLWYGAGVLCIAALVVGLLLWRKLRAAGLQWDAAYTGWVSAYTKYSKRRDDEKSAEKDGAAQ